jgi:D-glycerate 3-kinase
MVDVSVNFDKFLREHHLPDAFAASVQAFYVPLARWVHGQVKERDGATFVLGINGAQGTGKSTLSNFLATTLQDDHGISVAELSIDDIYLTRAERAELAQRIHPLFATRGVPGTHDVELGVQVIDKLCVLRNGEFLQLPRFDKSIDDRRPASTWPVAEGPVDVIIFEGWCVASPAAPVEQLLKPVNRLEAEEDVDGSWRRHINELLGSSYSVLFDKIDALVVLQAPDFDAIYRWRGEQERKLAASAVAMATQIMREAELSRFIQHYERITRQNLAILPSIADVVLTLDQFHAVQHTRYTSG